MTGTKHSSRMGKYLVLNKMSAYDFFVLYLNSFVFVKHFFTNKICLKCINMNARVKVIQEFIKIH